MRRGRLRDHVTWGARRIHSHTARPRPCPWRPASPSGLRRATARDGRRRHSPPPVPRTTSPRRTCHLRSAGSPELPSAGAPSAGAGARAGHSHHGPRDSAEARRSGGCRLGCAAREDDQVVEVVAGRAVERATTGDKAKLRPRGGARHGLGGERPFGVLREMWTRLGTAACASTIGTRPQRGRGAGPVRVQGRSGTLIASTSTSGGPSVAGRAGVLAAPGIVGCGGGTGVVE